MTFSSPLTRSGQRKDRGSGIYHLPGCSAYAGMNPASIVAFSSEAAALQAGYRRAKSCP